MGNPPCLEILQKYMFSQDQKKVPKLNFMNSSHWHLDNTTWNQCFNSQQVGNKLPQVRLLFNYSLYLDLPFFLRGCQHDMGSYMNEWKMSIHHGLMGYPPTEVRKPGPLFFTPTSSALSYTNSPKKPMLVVEPTHLNNIKLVKLAHLRR